MGCGPWPTAGLLALRPENLRLVGDSASAYSALTPKCVRALSPDAIVSTMPLKNKLERRSAKSSAPSPAGAQMRAHVCVRPLRKAAAGW
jgi:hypothetical protein